MSLKFSQSLKTLLERKREHPLTIADILAETSERSFALVIILLIFPFLLPMPPGFSSMMGSACLLISLQMAWGRRVPWLPARFLKYELSQSLITRILKLLSRVITLVEKVSKPRWRRFTQRNSVWKVNGLCISWLTVLLMLPFPFTNPIPTVGILILAIATVETDGLLMLLGYVILGLNTALFGAISYLLWRSPEFLQNIL